MSTTIWLCEKCGNKLHNCLCTAVLPDHKLKAVPTVTVLPVTTTLDQPCERILNGALEAPLRQVIVIGFDADMELYFASSMADGGDVLWWLEVAKRRLFA